MPLHRARLLVGLLLALALTTACRPPAPTPIDPAAAREIKSGTPLAEIEAVLGPAHRPTAAQAAHLDGILARMPERLRANAQQDRSLAWGDDRNFVVAKVNAEGIAWVTGWRSGS